LSRSIILLLVILWSFPAAPASAQMGLMATLGGGGRQAPAQAAASDRLLDPVSLGAPAVTDGDASFRPRYHAAIVRHGRTRGAGDIVRKVKETWTRRGMTLVPETMVEGGIRRLGLLSPEALAPADLPQLGRILSTRYLVVLNVKQDRAGRQLGAGTSVLGAVGAGRLVTMGGPDGDRRASPWLIGAAAATLLMVGVTTSATCELGSQIFDCARCRTVWVSSASATRKKVLFGLFADKHELADRARSEAVDRLYAVVVDELRQVSGLRAFPDGRSRLPGEPRAGAPGPGRAIRVTPVGPGVPEGSASAETRTTGRTRAPRPAGPGTRGRAP